MNKVEIIWTIIGVGAFIVTWLLAMYLVTKPKKEKVAKETIVSPDTITTSTGKPVWKVIKPNIFKRIWKFIGTCLYWLYRNLIVRPIKAAGRFFNWIYRKPIVGSAKGIVTSTKWTYKIGSKFFGYLASIVGTIIIVGLAFGIPYLVYRYDTFWGVVVAGITGIFFLLYKFGKRMLHSGPATAVTNRYQSWKTKRATRVKTGNAKDIVLLSSISIVAIVASLFLISGVRDFFQQEFTLEKIVRTVAILIIIGSIIWAITSIYKGKPILKTAIIGASSILLAILVLTLWPFGFGNSKKPELSKTEIAKPVTPKPQPAPIAQIVDRVVDTSIVAPVGTWNTFDIPDRDGNMSSDIFSQDSLMVLLPNGVIWYGLKVNDHISFYLDNKGLTHIPVGRVERGHMRYSVQSFASKQKDFVHIRYGPTKLFAQK